MSHDPSYAPGWPGIEPRWTSSAKDGVGAAVAKNSRVWFTLSHGILNEIYYPRVDEACIRDCGLIVTDGASLFAEEKRHTETRLSWLEPGVPAWRIENTCPHGRFRVHKLVYADADRDVVLQRVHFEPLQGGVGDYHLYALLAPHLSNHGCGNTAWVGAYKDTPMLFAQRGSTALALAASQPWRACSVGFVGVSDGWQDLSRHCRLTRQWERAENGNVAMVGEIALPADGSPWMLAIAFGETATEAGHRARAALQQSHEDALQRYVQGWRDWQANGHRSDDLNDAGRISAAVIGVHGDKRFPGGIIASLSIPWGMTKGDEDLGGYHLVWARDLVETAGALTALGASASAGAVLAYLRATQEADGHWPQNMWLDGAPYWHGVQLDETALPILLVDLLQRHGALSAEDSRAYWPMVLNAAGFLVRNGPVTQQDRWEEDPGYAPFTLAATIAALTVASDMAARRGAELIARYLQETADAWFDALDRWTYATGTTLAKQVGVEGYYVRIAPPEQAEAASPIEGFVPVKNRPPEQATAPASLLVSPDALAMVRFGLRAADDPRIVNTVRVIDAVLRVELPAGPAWRRYSEDGYGEHDDGTPFDGTGVGRPWPLLTGERAHYEIAAGRHDVAERLLRTMESFRNDGGLLPEQVWDGDDLPEHELRFGRPSGSATPLVWAHAEHLKLRRSLRDGRVFDTPAVVADRYLSRTAPSDLAPWRFNHKARQVRRGQRLRIETLAPARVHWSADNWATVHDDDTTDTGLGVHHLDLPTATVERAIVFTFQWLEHGTWEGADFEVQIVE